MNWIEKLNKVCKWRTLLTGWQLGTRPKGDPEGDAVRDHRESTLIQRVEISATANLLIAKGVFTLEEYQAQIGIEADELELLMQKRFPGIAASETGLVIDVKKAAETMRGWKP